MVENDKAAVQMAGSVLESKYFLEFAQDAEEGFFYAESKDFDLIIASRCPTHANALAFCQKLRQQQIEVPILLLIDQADTADKIAGLEFGADDYLVKPYNDRELLAHIKVLLSRPKNLINPEIISAGDLILDLNQKIVTIAGKIIYLRRKELHLLEYLIKNKGRVVSREMILDNVWRANTEPCATTVNVHIKYLRDCIEKPFNSKFIHTIYGIGYKFEA